MRSFTIASLILTAASSVSAMLNIHNWCDQDVYIWQSNNGGCDQGPNKICVGDTGAAPSIAPAGSFAFLDWQANNFGTAIKMSTTSTDNDGILQFEYTMGNGGNYWDLSYLDGLGAGAVGTPFANGNVRVLPLGPGVGTGGGDCAELKCPSGQTCTDAYLNPEDTKTHYCPETVGTFWIDLCMPSDQFTKRHVSFSS